MNDIAQNVPVVEVFTEKSACIIDGMSIVQKLDGNQNTFGDIAKTVLKIVICKETNATGSMLLSMFIEKVQSKMQNE